MFFFCTGADYGLSFISTLNLLKNIKANLTHEVMVLPFVENIKLYKYKTETKCANEDLVMCCSSKNTICIWIFPFKSKFCSMSSWTIQPSKHHVITPRRGRSLHREVSHALGDPWPIARYCKSVVCAQTDTSLHSRFAGSLHPCNFIQER